MMELLAQMIANQGKFDGAQVLTDDAELGRRTVRALRAALQVRGGWVETHSGAVAELAAEIGGRLQLHARALEDLREAAGLHDIGKLGISDAVLQKPGPLGGADWLQMRRHPALGANLISAMRPVAHLAPTIRSAHEHWDGTGYPDGLAGEEIPVGSRIVLIADAIDAMTSDRPYRRAMTTGGVCEELAANCGTQFWPDGVVAALELLGDADGRPVARGQGMLRVRSGV